MLAIVRYVLLSLHPSLAVPSPPFGGTKVSAAGGVPCCGRVCLQLGKGVIKRKRSALKFTVRLAVSAWCAIWLLKVDSLYSYVRYHRVSVGKHRRRSLLRSWFCNSFDQFARSAMRSWVCASDVRMSRARPLLLRLLMLFFGFIYRSLQRVQLNTHTHTQRGVCIPSSHGSFESSYTLRKRAIVQRHVGSVGCVCVFVIVVSHQLILRGLESKLLARRVAAAPCSPPRGRTLVSGRQQPQRAGTRQQRDPVGAVETSTATGARYMTSFLCIRRARFVGKYLNVILLLMLVLRCVFTTRRHWVSSHGLPAARGE